ncbi:MAG: penicillin-binding transpeptidase domain-containing protein [Candidatus Omnitrophica bacterium]|nr:penicillin-binding transpeptidase domain-containing protein [Candidatus Omnitrophota bacterium]MDD5310447.1 penicillin-binding transpeptidase domain-containing protein [Candidatus Omnitrophota bacterium]MDD5546709.1 penicillin-binding transpeptidase domain-containing protein [Candidatus Omnitrophota bacterium]
MYTRAHKTRLNAVFSFFIILLSILLIRVLYLQLARSYNLTLLAKKQHTALIELQPTRGTIFDRNMRPLAVSLNMESVFADNRVIADKKAAAKKLASAMGLSEQYVYQRINRDKGFVWIKRKLSPAESARVKALKIKGIDFLKESKRVYPNNSLASQIVGYAGTDNKGLEGLELKNDGYLKGSPGYRATYRDARRREIASFEYEYYPAADGLDLVLTIDDIIQHIAERELDWAVKKFHPIGACIIVMDPNNGDILAMSSRPTYDLNAFQRASAESRRNRAVTDMYEPGSIFKIVTASAALEEKKVGLKDRFFCENGAWSHGGGKVLHDHTGHGWLTFREVIEKSSNIGTVKVALKLGGNNLYTYVRKFGFGDMTGIDLPGEVPGFIRPPSKWSGTSIYAIPMGQEVSVSALQMGCAISVIANGGKLVKPRVIQAIQDKHGEIIKEFPTVVVRETLSEGTAATMRDILSGVVADGTGKLAQVEGYDVAGKTGTSQKIENGAYSHSKFIGSFVGFAPVKDPKIVVVVMLDQPHPQYYGGVVAAPVFSKVVKDTLRYMEIKPQNITEVKRPVELQSVED